MLLYERTKKKQIICLFILFNVFTIHMNFEKVIPKTIVRHAPSVVFDKCQQEIPVCAIPNHIYVKDNLLSRY